MRWLGSKDELKDQQSLAHWWQGAGATVADEGPSIKLHTITAFSNGKMEAPTEAVHEIRGSTT